MSPLLTYTMLKYKEILQGIINTTLMDHMWNQDRFIPSTETETSNTNHSKEVRMKYAMNRASSRNRIILLNILTVFTLAFLQLIEFSQRISPLYNIRKILIYNNKLLIVRLFHL